MELNENDIDVLLESLVAWESKDFGTDLMMTLVESMFTDKKDPEQKAKMESDRLERQKKSENESKLRKETSTLLKAKLIQFKQTLAVNKLEKFQQ